MTTKELIAKYPKIFQQYEGNPYEVNWYGVPEGWLSVIDKLCGSIQSYVDNTTIYEDGGKRHTPQPVCIQMKEKYGGLRFYVDNSDERVEGMIRMAEYICDNTCEGCGSEKDLGVTRGWISVLCRTCAIASGDRAMNSWEPKNKDTNGNTEREGTATGS